MNTTPTSQDGDSRASTDLCIRTDKDLQAFWKAILPDFVEVVNPDNGFLEKLYAGEVLTDTDYESLVTGKDNLPMRNRARKLWFVLSGVSLDVFVTKVAPRLCAEYAAIIPERFFVVPKENIKTVSCPAGQCLRHNIQRRVRLEKLADILCHQDCLSREYYGSVITEAARKPPDKWNLLFHVFTEQPRHIQVALASELREVCRHYSIPCPENLDHMLSRGFPCTCDPPEPSPPQATLSSKKQVRSWLEKRRLHESTQSLDSSLTRVDISSSSLSSLSWTHSDENLVGSPELHVWNTNVTITMPEDAEPMNTENDEENGPQEGNQTTVDAVDIADGSDGQSHEPNQPDRYSAFEPVSFLSRTDTSIPPQASAWLVRPCKKKQDPQGCSQSEAVDVITMENAIGKDATATRIEVEDRIDEAEPFIIQLQTITEETDGISPEDSVCSSCESFVKFHDDSFLAVLTRDIGFIFVTNYNFYTSLIRLCMGWVCCCSLLQEIGRWIKNAFVCSLVGRFTRPLFSCFRLLILLTYIFPCALIFFTTRSFILTFLVLCILSTPLGLIALFTLGEAVIGMAVASCWRSCTSRRSTKETC